MLCALAASFPRKNGWVDFVSVGALGAACDGGTGVLDFCALPDKMSSIFAPESGYGVGQ